MKRLLCAVFAMMCLMATQVMAGGYEGVLDHYLLTALDDSNTLMYQDVSISSEVLAWIPSGTTIRVIKSNHAGRMSS